MAKKKNWFSLVKWFFTSNTESQKEKEEKRRKWIFFRKIRVRSKIPALAAPTSSPPRERAKLSDAKKEHQSKRALNAALATSDAAEAAVATAKVAAEVVVLTGVPHCPHQCEEQAEEHSASTCSPHFSTKWEAQELAALRIQTAFRGYLARKALRALKGIVVLQAIIRGRNVRVQTLTTLKCLQSIVNIQSQICARRVQKVEETWLCNDNRQLQHLDDKIIKMDVNSQRRWDGSMLTKEEADAMFLSKKEAAIKRERIKEYSFSHRNSAETERNKANGRWGIWLEQWVDNQISKGGELEDLDSIVAPSPSPSPSPRVEYRGKQLKQRSLMKQSQYLVEGLDSPASATAALGRSFHRKQCSLGEDSSFSTPHVIPTYMAATESAKAKARSMSSPKLRPCSYDVYSDGYSPSKNRHSVMSSETTEAPGTGRFGKSSAYFQQQRSSSLKGLSGLAKSSRTLKDLSFDADCSFTTCHQQNAFGN